MTDSIPSWAVPGARVVCVNPLGWMDSDDSQFTTGPAYEDIVTVTGAAVNAVYGALIFLKEYPVTNPDDGFLASVFKPAVEPRTEQEDVAFFTDLVKGMTLVERLDRLKESLDA